MSAQQEPAAVPARLNIELQQIASTPHPIHVVDGTLPSAISPFVSRVTFGFIPPGTETMIPAVTIAISTEALYNAVKTLALAIEQGAPRIKAEYERFTAVIESGAVGQSPQGVSPKAPTGKPGR